ncbi:MAG TPA: tetratricopeptide repeat protein [Actinomycetota bacterium]|nr:tetratricopeptide repeat protein [Actinomycetota bacterium]
MYSRHLRGQNAYDLFSRGLRFLEQGHPHQAAMYLTRAKLIEPEKVSIRTALGRALYMSGRMARARREFTKVVQIDPADDYGHFALGLACERTGQRTRALGHLKLAVVMRPDVSDYERALRRLAG